MGDAHGQLCQPLPERTFVLRAVLPRRFENFVGAERLATVEQILGVGESFGR